MVGVIFLGGTIGSSVSEGYISTDSKKAYKLIEMYEEKYGQTEFTVDRPCEILSENITCKDYDTIYLAVQSMLRKNVDGIILTHGSDTIQYTAAFLSCVMDVSVPVMIVCSNYVLEDKRANGLFNFACAVDFIKNKCGRGVFVPYNGKIFYANTLLAHDMYSDELRSVNGVIYGDYNEGYFVASEKENPCRIKHFEYSVSYGKETSDVFVIKPYPGMKYPHLNGEKAVLLLTYHSGTICTVSEELRQFADDAKKRNIPIYVVGVSSEAWYESCKAYEELGFNVFEKVTEYVAYMELWLGK